MPGAPPPGMMAPPHPSAARLNDLLEFVKAEFEQVAGEGGMLRAQKDEYEAMSKLFCTFEMYHVEGTDLLSSSVSQSTVHSHAAELNAMRAMAYDLERKYHDDKRVYVSFSNMTSFREATTDEQMSKTGCKKKTLAYKTK